MLRDLKQDDLAIKQLGRPVFESPLLEQRSGTGGIFSLTHDDDLIPYSLQRVPQNSPTDDLFFEKAGARERIFFDGPHATAAIVTCGGLCPGLNDVIRALYLTLYYGYGLRKIYGIRYGLAGLAPGTETPPVLLTAEQVENIHKAGGTVLGSSRGQQDVSAMVDTIVSLGVDLLFCIGGDGTFRGADAITDEIGARNQKISVIGVPKTIDNDIPLVYKSFGFETAVEQASMVLGCAHVEAKGARNGVGLVKLMGRHAGFITAMATRANGDVNFCLIPEVDVVLHGRNGFLEHLRSRLKDRHHAVVAVAEGACQNLIGHSAEHDDSGNIRFNDVGLFLKEEIQKAFAVWQEEVQIRYFDPSYIIRSVPANGPDSIFCADLARYAVHAGMAGKTGIFVGFWHGYFTHVPFSAIRGKTKLLTPASNLWRSVLNTTGQPVQWG